jgi:hypothetical protein
MSAEGSAGDVYQSVWVGSWPDKEEQQDAKSDEGGHGERVDGESDNGGACHRSLPAVNLFFPDAVRQVATYRLR